MHPNLFDQFKTFKLVKPWVGDVKVLHRLKLSNKHILKKMNHEIADLDVARSREKRRQLITNKLKTSNFSPVSSLS